MGAIHSGSAVERFSAFPDCEAGGQELNLKLKVFTQPWTVPMLVDKFCPHDEACSKASGLTPPR
ncbi:hypothetical protein B8043_12740 [Klebsiella aerogenes]|nr:hypothetical protein B8043_12740 [Klebsiella aerogenes]